MKIFNQSVAIKQNTIQSLYHFAPINTGLALNGNPTNELIEFHRKRSSRNLGINYIGNVAISSDKTTNNGTLFINDSMNRYDELVEKISIDGVLAGVQVSCLKSNYVPLRVWSNKNSKDYIIQTVKEISELKESDISNIIEDFQRSIITLIDKGFKVVQLHCAHGYLLNNFLSSTFNKREDEYGSDRSLIIKNILEPIKSYLSNVIVDIRLSVFENKSKMNLDSDQIQLLDSVVSISSVDMVSISNGLYNLSKPLIYPNRKFENNFMFRIMKDYISENLEKHWNLSGNINNLNDIVSFDNISYSVGRSLLADERFLDKSLSGNFSEINQCTSCGKCHYYSRNKASIECGVNDNLYLKMTQDNRVNGPTNRS